MSRRPRDPYLEVGEATRAAIEAACAADLAPLQHRALLAVIHFTSTRSYLTATVYLGQIAAVMYGVERSVKWQEKRAREALRHLQAAGIIACAPPRGRPSRPAYWVSIRPTDPAPSEPDTSGLRSEPDTQGPLDAQRTRPPGSATQTLPTAPADPTPRVRKPSSGPDPQGPYRGIPTGYRGTPEGEKGGSSNGPAEGGPTTTTPTEAERRDAARHAITTGTTHNPLAHAYSALTRPDPQGEADDGYLDELEHAIRQWTYGVTEAETTIALDTLDRTDHGTHPLQAAHQAATTWATHPARDHDPTQIPRPPKDLR